MNICREQLAARGYVTTHYGRRRYLSLDGNDQEQERAWRQAVNLPIQGTAAEVMKKALAGVADKYPILTVHDEIVADVPEHLTIDIARAIISVMEAAWPPEVNDFVPIEVHATAGVNWKDMTPLEVRPV